MTFLRIFYPKQCLRNIKRESRPSDWRLPCSTVHCVCYHWVEHSTDTAVDEQCSDSQESLYWKCPTIQSTLIQYQRFGSDIPNPNPDPNPNPWQQMPGMADPNPNPNPWRQMPGMADLRNGGPPEWRAITISACTTMSEWQYVRPAASRKISCELCLLSHGAPVSRGQTVNDIL